MAKRTKQQQTKHDKRIASLARKDKRGGARVRADIIDRKLKNSDEIRKRYKKI